MKVIANIRNRYILIGDMLLTAGSVLASYALRLELGAAFWFYMPSAYWMIGISLVVKPIVYYFFGLYRRMWAYASTKELRLIITAITAASVLVSLVLITAFSMGAFIGFPRSVLVIDWLLSIILIGGIRITIRILSEMKTNTFSGKNGKPARRVLIIGAGDAGALVVRELQKNQQLNLSPVGFLDDNPVKQKQQIYGVPVVGTIKDLSKAIDTRRISEVIIAVPSAPGRVVRTVTEVCQKKNIPFRTMPGIFELLVGKVSINRLREVDITDLLRREPAHVQEEKIGDTIKGQVVLVTGAGGSIGQELCRQIARWDPAELVLLGHGENSIFESTLELREMFPSLTTHPVIADIRDRSRLDSVLSQFLPHIVFHAAAHKHVPMMELNVEDAVSNNVYGTWNIVQAAHAHDVQRMVMISTDKAIRPINVMGATKRIAEMIVLDAAMRCDRDYSVVRFGNVLGSRGSVVPLFKRQITRGGPITVTHPEMRRYFMTIPEAVYLVLQAASLGLGGETYVLNMGQQVRILDLAEDLIRLSGLEPGRDIEIVFSGIRPGEKLSEDLWDEHHKFQPTEHPDIYKAVGEITLTGNGLQKTVNQLIQFAHEGDADSIADLLDQSIPDSAVKSASPIELLAVD